MEILGRAVGEISTPVGGARTRIKISGRRTAKAVSRLKSDVYRTAKEINWLAVTVYGGSVALQCVILYPLI